MEWSHVRAPQWPGTISNEAAKRQVAERVASRAADGEVIGIGSGSTSFLALLALADRVQGEGLAVTCVPTSHEIAGYCTALGLPTVSLLAGRPDWCFDGADEVDPERNLIKGRGGAFVREKLVFAAARQRFILVDDSKFVTRLGERFAVPLEVIPEAVNLVRDTLADVLGSVPTIRPAGGKDGGVITEQGGIIMDLHVTEAVLDAHTPTDLAVLLDHTVGITGSGLFAGFDLEVLSDS